MVFAIDFIFCFGETKLVMMMRGKISVCDNVRDNDDFDERVGNFETNNFRRR